MTTETKKVKIKEEGSSAFSDFVDEFKDESDRAAVILGAAKLDLLLYQVLVRFLIPNAGSMDELLDGDGPLSTFSAKINTCYRLGLIDSDFARALHLTRKIRNSFAHEVMGCKLESGSHRDRIKEFVAPLEHYENFSEFKKIFFPGEAGPAADFKTALTTMVVRLEGARDRLESLDRSNETSLVPPLWHKTEANKDPSKDDKS